MSLHDTNHAPYFAGGSRGGETQKAADQPPKAADRKPPRMRMGFQVYQPPSGASAAGSDGAPQVRVLRLGLWEHLGQPVCRCHDLDLQHVVTCVGICMKGLTLMKGPASLEYTFTAVRGTVLFSRGHAVFESVGLLTSSADRMGKQLRRASVQSAEGKDTQSASLQSARTSTPLASVIAEQAWVAPEPSPPIPTDNITWDDDPRTVSVPAPWKPPQQTFTNGYWTPSTGPSDTDRSTQTASTKQRGRDTQSQQPSSLSRPVEHEQEPHTRDRQSGPAHASASANYRDAGPSYDTSATQQQGRSLQGKQSSPDGPVVGGGDRDADPTARNQPASAVTLQSAAVKQRPRRKQPSAQDGPVVGNGDWEAAASQPEHKASPSLTRQVQQDQGHLQPQTRGASEGEGAIQESSLGKGRKPDGKRGKGRLDRSAVQAESNATHGGQSQPNGHAVRCTEAHAIAMCISAVVHHWVDDRCVVRWHLRCACSNLHCPRLPIMGQ